MTMKTHERTPQVSLKSATDLVKSVQDLILKTVYEGGIDAVISDIMPEVKKKIVETYGVLPELHKVQDGPETRTFTGTTHEKFDTILNIVKSGLPVYLYGKAGTGKNVICKQVSEALGLDFYFTNAVTQEYRLTGFIDANGSYHETQFYKAFVNGGLFLLDEIDASIPEVLVILNAAIANGYFDFPIGKVYAHKNFRVIAAANTVGLGADTSYTGRYSLDRASLDRFAMIPIDYSPKIESSLCEDNQQLLKFARTFRSIVDKNGITCLFSYRSIARIHTLEKLLPLSDVLDISLFKGLDKDDIAIIKKEFSKEGLGSNKYVMAING